MPFSVENIEPAEHAIVAYTVAREKRDHRPCARAPGARLVKRREDPREHIARRFNAIEEAENVEPVAAALRSTLGLLSSAAC
jgi:hypothetical protein